MVEYLNMIKSYGDHCMVKMLNGEKATTRSYADYYRDIRSCAHKLESVLGEVRDCHIGLLGSNDYDYLVLMAAIIFSRAVCVPINNHESQDNILSAIRKADLDLLVTWEETTIALTDESVRIVNKNFLFEGNLVENELSDFANEEADRTALIIFTSGSTSLSKGVELSVGGLFDSIRSYLAKETVDITEAPLDATGYINYPFYHLGGTMSWLAWTEFGITIALSVDARNILFDLANNRIDIAAVTPAVLKLWVKCLQNKKPERLGGVKYIVSGGAAIAPEIINLFTLEGITIIQLYGMTETGGDITVNQDMINHGASVGKAAVGVNIYINDGEICVKSKSSMKGYYKNPQETDKVLKEGIIYTGDLGYIDDEGYVYITGRKKNLIILSGGENVSPEEIEAKLYDNSLISECKVYEENDRIAATIFAPGASEETIKDYVAKINSELPIYKRIYKVALSERELEKTAIGKIKRQVSK